MSVRDLSKGSSHGPYPEDASALVDLLFQLTPEELKPLAQGLCNERTVGRAGCVTLSYCRSLVGRMSAPTRRQAWTWAGQCIDEHRQAALFGPTPQRRREDPS